MNLKKIEILGFKSFAEKVTIELKEGFTCVVGPNGCGKSNVADAIRWTLGEQSSKVLRGRKMSDVIFHGTEHRKPVSYCEVSLVFDNSTKYYEVDGDELIITRKLYRSGESEYYINNTAARLKDIVTLFRDTGIGKEGYSIIGQGAITDILSASPEARRKIFEEAAGISNQRVKRTEAEKRLEKAQTNLELVKYRKETLEKDLGPLAEQSEKAQKARSYRGRLKVLEVNSYLYQTENNAEKKATLSNKLKEEERLLEECRMKHEQAQITYDKLTAEINDGDRYRSELSERYTQIRIQHERVQSKHSTAGVRYEETAKRITELNAEKRQKEEYLERIKKELSQLKADKEEKLKSLTLLRQKEAALGQAVETAKENQRNKTREIEEINRLILSSSDQKFIVGAEQASIKVKIENLKEAIDNDKALIKELKMGLSAAEKDFNECEEKIAYLSKDLKAKQEKKEQADAAHLKLLEEKDITEDRANALSREINMLQGEIKTLEATLKSNSQYGDGVRNLLNSTDPEVKKRIVSLVGNALTVPARYQAAVSIALGRSAQNIITDDEDDTEYLVNVLKKHKQGRATFLAISKIMPRDLRREYRAVLEEEGCIGIASDLVRYDRKLKNIMSFLLGSVVIVEDYAAARKLSNKYQNSFRIVTLEGDDFAPGGATTGGYASKGGGFSLEISLNEKTKLLERKEGERLLLIGELKKSAEDLEKLVRISNILQLECQRMEKDKTLLEERNRYTAGEKARHIQGIQKLEEANAERQKALAELEKIYITATANVSDAESSKMSASDILSSLRLQFAEDEMALARQSKEYTAIQLEVNTLQNNIDSITSSINTAEGDIKYTTESILDARAKLNTLEAQLKLAEKELEESQLGEEAQKELNEVRRLMEEADKRKENLMNEQSQANKLSNALSKEIGERMMDRALTETKLCGLDENCRELENRLREEYDIDPLTEAAELRRDDFDEKEAEQEIRKLKRELSRLGDINECAVEQYQEKKAEYDTLVAGYNDVVNTIESIQKFIDELTAEMESSFSKCFDQIAKNFKEVFAQMFDGGVGYLELDKAPGESVLSAGIEIYAVPKGKRIGHITLLSGGERALTAIAILFAIIKLKPMPFCVLDEIEAALDDANTYLFAKFLRTYCELTQFLVISHKKPTMELADTIFGVTMQERGVSQLVNIRLSDALRHAETK